MIGLGSGGSGGIPQIDDKGALTEIIVVSQNGIAYGKAGSFFFV
jgi:hypothetical protein